MRVEAITGHGRAGVTPRWEATLENLASPAGGDKGIAANA
jgi:hypothetical protein